MSQKKKIIGSILGSSVLSTGAFPETNITTKVEEINLETNNTTEEENKKNKDFSEKNVIKNFRSRSKRNINNFIDYKFSTDNYFVDSNSNSFKQTDVPYPVTTMYTFNLSVHDNYGNRKFGDVYFGTTNGLYLRKSGELTTSKINGIDGTISMIQPHLNNGVHVITTTGAIYYVNNNNLAALKQTDVPYPVTTMYTFNLSFHDNYGNRKFGDVYFGTTNGLYLRKSGELTTSKINGIDGTIRMIQHHLYGNVHVITAKGEVYFVDSNSNSFKQTDVPYPVTTMYTFINSYGNRKFGDVYFGTTNGLYLRKNGESSSKINGIDGTIRMIQHHLYGNVHVITAKGEVYFVDSNSNSFKQTDVPYPVTTMYTFINSYGNRKFGDVYFGTTNGLYLRKNGESSSKINGIDGTIGMIQHHSNGNVHVIKLKIYKTKNNLTRRANIPALNSVPSVRQTKRMWCGPAIGEAVLRHFNHNESQANIAHEMGTDLESGTTPENWIEGINNYLERWNLNNQRRYSLHRLASNYRNSEQFYHYVLDSLENNMPVAFASSSRIDRYDHVNSPHYNHFILITGVRPSMPNNLSQHNYIYTYMDPDDGTFKTFGWWDILQRTSGPDSSYLISYSPDTQEIETNMRQLSLNNERVSEEGLQDRTEEINHETFMGTYVSTAIIGLFICLISSLQ